MRPHHTVRIIRDEHSTLSAVLRSIGLLLGESRRHGIEPDFKVLRAMLFYIGEYPEKVHHTKETELLFPLLRSRSKELASVLDRLDRDHAASHRAVLDLEHEVLALEMMSEAPQAKARLADFETRMHAYIASYLDHMRVEEVEVVRGEQRGGGAFGQPRCLVQEGQAATSGGDIRTHPSSVTGIRG